MDTKGGAEALTTTDGLQQLVEGIRQSAEIIQQSVKGSLRRYQEEKAAEVPIGEVIEILEEINRSLQALTQQTSASTELPGDRETILLDDLPIGKRVFVAELITFGRSPILEIQPGSSLEIVERSTDWSVLRVNDAEQTHWIRHTKMPTEIVILTKKEDKPQADEGPLEAA